MKRLLLLAAATMLVASVLAGSASAKIIQLGQTATPITAPACPKGVSPAQCYIVLQHTTAVQSVSDGVRYPTTVKKNGWLVAFTVGLSRLSSSAKTERSFLHTLNGAYGGPPQLQLTVLKPGPKSRFTVAAESAVFHVTPFLGSILEEPLSLPDTFKQFTALPVTAGEVIGLTVPTWAPVLSYNLNNQRFSYRQSREANCQHAAAGQTAQSTIGESTRYLCTYTGTRVEFSVTEITNTPYPKTYVHPPRR